MYFDGVLLARGIKLHLALLNEGPISKTVVPISPLGNVTWGNRIQVEKYQSYPLKCLQCYIFIKLHLQYVLSNEDGNNYSIIASEMALRRVLFDCSHPLVIGVFFLDTTRHLFPFQVKHRESHLPEDTCEV